MRWTSALVFTAPKTWTSHSDPSALVITIILLLLSCAKGEGASRQIQHKTTFDPPAPRTQQACQLSSSARRRRAAGIAARPPPGHSQAIARPGDGRDWHGLEIKNFTLTSCSSQEQGEGDAQVEHKSASSSISKRVESNSDLRGGLRL